MAAFMLIAITSVCLHGQILEPGTEFTCDTDYAKKLVDGGSARLKKAENGVDIGESDQKRGGNSNENDGNEAQNTEDLAKKLDALTVPKLEELAEKHQISLDSAKKKPEIIGKIVESGVVLDETDF